MVSSNIVGYNRVSINAGLSILGQQFVAIGGDSNGIENLAPGEDFDPWGSDFVQVWNGSDYETYSYYGADAGGVGDDAEAGWGDESQGAVSATIVNGQAFWVNASADTTLTTSGEVPKSNTVAINTGLSLVCNPQPAAINIQDIVPDENFDPWGSDFIQIWNGSDYETYSYYGEDAGGVGANGEAGWGDESQSIVDVTIPAGVGFWVNSSADSVLTFPDNTSSDNN